MLLATEDTKAEAGMKTLHQQLNDALIGDLGPTVSRIDERGLRMPSWWDPRDSEGVTLEQAQATMLELRRRT